MARLWVLATIAIMLALAFLAGLPDDRVASSETDARVTAERLPATDAVAVAGEAQAGRRAYQRRAPRATSVEALPRDAVTLVTAGDSHPATASIAPERAVNPTAGDTAIDALPYRRHSGLDEAPRRLRGNVLVRRVVRHKETRLARHPADRESVHRRHAGYHRYHAPPRRKVPRRLASNELRAGPARGEGT